jgi:hypothetical protein
MKDGPCDPSLTKDWKEFRESGLLWLINRVVFHPRGYSIGLVFDAEGETCIGWQLSGDGSGCFVFNPDVEPERFDKVKELLK